MHEWHPCHLLQGGCQLTQADSESWCNSVHPRHLDNHSPSLRSMCLIGLPSFMLASIPLIPGTALKSAHLPRIQVY